MVSERRRLGEDSDSTANRRLLFNEDRLLVLRRRGDDLPRGINQRWCSIPSGEFGDRRRSEDAGDAADGGDERLQILANGRQQRGWPRFNDGRRQHGDIVIVHAAIIELMAYAGIQFVHTVHI